MPLTRSTSAGAALLACLLALAPGSAEGRASSPAQTLAGRTIVLDPGHNGGSARAPKAINRLVPIGGWLRKACDTTGTATAGGSLAASQRASSGYSPATADERP